LKVSVSKETESDVDWELMGMEKPNVETTYRTIFGYLQPSKIIAVEPIEDEDGSFIYLHPEIAWKSSLSPEDVVKMIEEA